MIYLDNHATTPCDPRVVDEMYPYFSQIFGNPSSSIHNEGKKVAYAVEQARRQVAHLINANEKEVIFSSGATESNNIAIQGLVRGSTNRRKKIITSPIEHKSILNQCKELSKHGYTIVLLSVNKFGEVDLLKAEREIDDNTLVVSVQTASNEIGTIQPVKELAALAHSKGAFFHTDAAQAVGKIPVDVRDWDIDLLSISAHKLYGPKGVGALYVKHGVYSMPISPLVYGGEQEFNLRSGTLNAPGIIGLGKACEICSVDLFHEAEHLSKFRDKMELYIIEQVGALQNGSLNHRLPNNSSLTFQGIDAEALIVNMPELALSTGSACSSGALEPSPILLAIGLSRADAECTIRIGLGRFSSEKDVMTAAELICQTVRKIQTL